MRLNDNDRSVQESTTARTTPITHKIASVRLALDYGRAYCLEARAASFSFCNCNDSYLMTHVRPARTPLLETLRITRRTRITTVKDTLNLQDIVLYHVPRLSPSPELYAHAQFRRLLPLLPYPISYRRQTPSKRLALLLPCLSACKRQSERKISLLLIIN